MLLKSKKAKEFVFKSIGGKCILEVGECAGFDEETREMFSNDKELWIGEVIEVRANELFKDTGKLRHPRYLRFRKDKSGDSCTFKDHIGVD